MPNNTNPPNGTPPRAWTDVSSRSIDQDQQASMARRRRSDASEATAAGSWQDGELDEENQRQLRLGAEKKCRKNYHQGLQVDVGVRQPKEVQLQTQFRALDEVMRVGPGVTNTWGYSSGPHAYAQDNASYGHSYPSWYNNAPALGTGPARPPFAPSPAPSTYPVMSWDNRDGTGSNAAEPGPQDEPQNTAHKSRKDKPRRH